ncbi:MAG: hypothetical protein E7773_12875 [Sphingomonas sp.]|uniref:hypothetical protein n=1 Tax=Sphingomonas sp. TaxID=28214 RepID=UPI00122629E5|nr:hypothetical protein [Sphingomonas sp.]THD35325.1 MAG: hypothetical protein E7773_12875 [Sphingomonas sp.]
MFIGHYAPAFVAATSPKSPRLGALFVAAQLVDIAFFSFLILDVEHLRFVPHATAMNAMDLYDMPWTHSLAGAISWGVLFALAVKAMRGSWTAGAIGGAVVVSHWLIDLLVHRPDLTLAGRPPALGLGLWNHPWVEIPLELAFAFGGLWFFVSRTRAIGAAGRWSPLALAVAMAALQAVNWLTPQPDAIAPAPPATGWLGLFAYAVLAVLAWWVARTRRLA